MKNSKIQKSHILLVHNYQNENNIQSVFFLISFTSLSAKISHYIFLRSARNPRFASETSENERRQPLTFCHKIILVKVIWL